MGAAVMAAMEGFRHPIPARFTAQVFGSYGLSRFYADRSSRDYIPAHGADLLETPHIIFGFPAREHGLPFLRGSPLQRYRLVADRPTGQCRAETEVRLKLCGSRNGFLLRSMNKEH